MKRCPSCQRSYTDDTQMFCLSDGTPLVSEAAPSPAWTPPAGTPNPVWTPPGAGAQAAQKKSILPWVLAGVFVLLLGFVAIAGVAAFFLLRNSSSENSRNDNSIICTSNENDENSNSGSQNTGSQNSSDVPTNKALVLKQLYDIEYAWCAAELKGDTAAIDRLLASEFTATLTDGTTQNKQQYLASMKPDEYERSCSYSDFSLGQSANYAVIIGYNTITGRDANGPYTERFKFTDTFVWRDGRWQATATKSTKVT
jgi:hypothetical protein